MRGRRRDVPAVRRGARHPPAGRHVPRAASRGTSRTRRPTKYPLLLHFHPLVIYRHQVLKQADVVLAMFAAQRPVHARRRSAATSTTTTRSPPATRRCRRACRRSAAAQIGYDDLAVDYFREALFVDLADTHGNTDDGVHVASCGGVWGTIVFGFAGLFDSGTALRFSPSLPAPVGGHHVPHATPRLADARRARRRRVHGRRCSTATRCRSRARTAPSCASTSASATASPRQSLPE